MGMFDSILVPCPKCGKREEFQSKSGPCALSTYNLEDAPFDVLSDVNRHSPHTCEDCGTLFEVRVQILATSVVHERILCHHQSDDK
jgi:hypothetical protein